MAQARADYRREGVRDCSWLGSGAAGGAEGQLAACHECGALPYLSAVSCSCRYNSWLIQLLQPP